MDDLIIVSPATGLTTTENGETATFTIVLAAKPTADVTINISSSDPTEGSVSPASLTFTSANWNTPQTVTVTGVDDDLFDGDVAYTVITQPAVSGDPIYNGLDPKDVSVTNQDNDTVLIELDRFNADSQGNRNLIVLTWTTLSEIDNAGFNLWRSETKSGKYIKINSKIIEAKGGATQKAEYTYIDSTATDSKAKPAVTYYYKLEDIDTKGVSTFHGPVSAMIPMSKSAEDKATADYKSIPDYKSTVDYYPPYWFDLYSKPVWPPVYSMNYPVRWPYYPYP